ncbi:major capsid protein [Morganella morganii]|uniref:major capsid protein n=1 Tax=Morganella morganii TaxID=582 RepID=UPI003EC6654E
MNIIGTKKYIPAALLLLTSVTSGAALAAGESGGGVDLSQLTNAVDFGSVLVGIMAVASAIIALYAGFAGVRWILRMVKGA